MLYEKLFTLLSQTSRARGTKELDSAKRNVKGIERGDETHKASIANGYTEVAVVRGL